MNSSNVDLPPAHPTRAKRPKVDCPVLRDVIKLIGPEMKARARMVSGFKWPVTRCGDGQGAADWFAHLNGNRFMAIWVIQTNGLCLATDDMVLARIGHRQAPLDLIAVFTAKVAGALAGCERMCIAAHKYSRSGKT